MTSLPSLAVARTEWTRHQREFGRITERTVLLVTIAAGAVALGWFAHSLGRDLASGQGLPHDRLSLFLSIAFAWMVWRSSQYTHVRFEYLDPAFLLPTVPARTAVLGLLGFVYARLLATLAVPTAGVAVGLAAGLRSLTVAVTVIGAVACLAALAAALGTASRLGARLVARRLARARFYRDFLVVFGWVPLFLGWLVLQETSVSVAPLLTVVGALPLAWFVDLAFVGSVDAPSVSLPYALGAMGTVAVAVPVFATATVTVTRRLWETEPVSSTRPGGSRSLVSRGLVDRLLGAAVSRPVRTVARERWLMERRVPRGLLSTGYVLLLFGVFGLPLFLFGGPNGILLILAVGLGLAVGIAFASAPLGTEYWTLPMLLTTVSGRQFVSGLFLSAVLIATPVVTLVVLPVGVVSVVGPVQTVVIALVGIASCACAAAVAIAVGLAVQRHDLAPTPFFFTEVPVYAEPGLSGFHRLGSIFAVVLLANAPAFLGNAPSVYSRLSARGVPAGIVQVGSLFLTLFVLAAVTWTAFRIAVERFRRYRLGDAQ